MSLQDVRGMLSENKLPNNVFWDRLTKPDDLMPACHAEQTFVENNKNLDHEALVLSARQLKSHKDILHVSNFSNIRQKCSNSSVCVNCNNCWSHSLILCWLFVVFSCSWTMFSVVSKCSGDSILRSQKYDSFVSDLRCYVIQNIPASKMKIPRDSLFTSELVYFKPMRSD